MSVAEEEEFPATWEGGHALVIEYGDCELYGKCQCALDKPTLLNSFGMIKPNQSTNIFAEKWERHVMRLGAAR